MATDEREKTEELENEAPESEAEDSALDAGPRAEEVAIEGDRRGAPLDDGTPANLGATRYVHAALFGVAILAGIIGSKLVNAVWGGLLDWPDVVASAPFLLSYGEDERGTITGVVGAIIGLAVVIEAYRRETVRRFADDVAIELSRVSWPNRDAVMNGTLVVIVASAAATVFVTVLDRFWAFLSHLVYG